MVWTASTTAWTFCTSGSAIFKAGENADATAVADAANLAIISSEVQGRICAETRVDWYTPYSTLPNVVKDQLSSTSSCGIAIHISKYNPSSYFPGEANFLANVNYDEYTKGIDFLKNYNSDTLKTPISQS